MDLQAEKLFLIEQLLHTDDVKVLAEVRELLIKRINPIVGYEPNGTPITRQELISKLEIAEQQFKRGEYQTIEDVEKESEDW